MFIRHNVFNKKDYEEITHPNRFVLTRPGRPESIEPYCESCKISVDTDLKYKYGCLNYEDFSEERVKLVS